MSSTGTQEIFDSLKAAARAAPQEPGVYIWRDEESRIIYVGKAKSLRNRLSSYFAGGKDVKTTHLIRHAKSIETIIVSSEYEALLLENTLIKQHSPKYNINLKDGKTYPVIRITAEAYPRIFRTRHIVDDGSLYFGPYSNIQAVDKLLDLVEKLFPLRKCRSLKKRSSPCMYYHIDRCMAPCCGKISEEDYRIQVERVRKLLAGETEALTADLTARMKDAAASLKFEEAARLRNAVRAVEDLSEPSSVEDHDPDARDYIAWAAEGIFTTFSVFSMREGRMTGRDLFSSRSAAEENEALETFLITYYSPGRTPPPKIFLQSLSQENGEKIKPVELSSWFKEQFGYEPELLIPDDDEQRSRHHSAALAMARQNAQEELRRRLKERGAGPALDELRQALGLHSRPERIEGFDIAQLDGKHPVASLISFKNGVPDRKNYRYFKLRTVVGIVDDFAAMREAVHRRYSRLLKEGSDSGSTELPDLVLIDGGIGQVNAARGVMDELGMECDVAGLAKRDEEIWLPHAKEPIRLSKRSEALKVLQFVRDETHRFATGLNQKLRSKDLFLPALETVEGIGPKRAAAIMKVFGSLERIAAASPEEIAEKCSIPETPARAVRASAKLALQDQKAAKKRLAPGKAPTSRGKAGYGKAGSVKNSAASLAEEAFAAEEAPEYGKEG
ncbi:excinuclease ABC subunit UvrC [Leadbettera azotonutricia]|uniref:UvrABC system protein C n=1 Tax=Leadbettera azotonutricia (strain ATCC BAA-888 / DSM 13862 / ZAS-9) TaxID=545695 RepID=F5YCS3_LEAAZ|nr:excinuclease ABC subunit UvrC [Leadbettera azotonutricia]AEF83323.1 excinuclease ABC, C subunit [Leadbettera azotonutricia ZAS-9]